MNILSFAEIEKIMDVFKPLSGPGKLEAKKIFDLYDENQSRQRLNEVKIAFSFIQDKKILSDKIKYHLKRVPILPVNQIASKEEIFIVKKFLNNVKAIYSCLGNQERKIFNFHFEVQDLLEKLSLDSKSDEFYISNAYSLSLAKIREKIAEIENKEAQLKKDLFSKILSQSGLDFSKHDFLIVGPKFKDKKLTSITIEPYDTYSFLAKPVLSHEIVNLLFEKEKLIKEEKEVESTVVNEILCEIQKRYSQIKLLEKSIASIDIAFAAAWMAVELGLNPPVLEAGNIECEGAFLPFLKKELAEMKIDYTPLSFSFDKKINIITGPNMGGKTVAIKTIAVCQVLAQAGLFVPAKKYKAPFFSSIFCLGEKQQAGLSSFASEINDLVSVLSQSRQPCLIFSDEFARTTDSMQAWALLSSLIDFFSSQNIYFFVATHLSGLTQKTTVDFLSMRGFSSSLYKKGGHDKLETQIHKIKAINRCMRYELVKNHEKRESGDALLVAEILGLHKKILSTARKYLEKYRQKEIL